MANFYEDTPCKVTSSQKSYVERKVCIHYLVQDVRVISDSFVYLECSRWVKTESTSRMDEIISRSRISTILCCYNPTMMSVTSSYG